MTTLTNCMRTKPGFSRRPLAHVSDSTEAVLAVEQEYPRAKAYQLLQKLEVCNSSKDEQRSSATVAQLPKLTSSRTPAHNEFKLKLEIKDVN